MKELLTAYGTVGPFTLTLSRTAHAAGPGGYPQASLSLDLSNGDDVRPVAGYAEGAIATASAAGAAIMAAFAAAGADVTLGSARSTPMAAQGTAEAATYTNARTLTPGTPVPPGRGVIVRGSGTFALKLQGGGTVDLVDTTGGGGGTQYNGFAVVDADLTKADPTASVQVLY